MVLTMEQRLAKTVQAMTGRLIPAVPVPRHKNGEIHSEAQEAYAGYLSRQQIAGVAVWVHTGRGLHLQAEERKRIFQSWKSHLNEAQLLVTGVGSLIDTTLSEPLRLQKWRQNSITMAEEAASGGADALLVFPPVIFKELESSRRDAAIIEYHRELSALGVPLILFYLYEEAGGLAYSKEVLRELLGMPSVVGMKMAALESVMTLQEVSSLFSSEFPGKLLITGEDRMFGYSLMCGATGALVGLGAAFPNIQSDLITAYRSKDYPLFMDLSSRVDAYAMSTFTQPMDKYIMRMLWCLALQGIIPREAAHDMNGTGYEMEEIELEMLRQTIQQCRLY